MEQHFNFEEEDGQATAGGCRGLLGGFGVHQVGHTRLLLLPLTNIAPPLLKQQDPALSLSPPPP